MLGGMVKNGIGLGFIFHAIIPHDSRGVQPLRHMVTTASYSPS